MRKNNSRGHFTVSHETLCFLDNYLKVQNPDEYDAEIESIVEHLWSGIGEHEELLKPFFITYLQSSLLRPLYINFFALRELKSLYENVEVNISTIVLDIAARHLGLELRPERPLHDETFFLVRHYDFLKADRCRQSYWKRVLLSLSGACVGLIGRLRGVDVLYYLNAGKLEEFSRIPKALSAQLIPLRQSRRLDCDVNAISEQVRANIREMQLSIPQELVLELVEKRMLVYLPDVFNRIGTLAEFIEKHHIKLVIASAVTHENHLCLLAAAKLANVESLILSHGLTVAENISLHHYVTYQATFNDIEPRYAGAAQFSLRAH